ncbi:outer membrane lipoprotein-sorting protein [Sulfurimonas sp. HSL-3221]|uniref:outer membrane lipoprotein-sorting protein n=1 Tax=Sulfurimonadaceae TaxID=2771471 RepID=UPI001E2C5D4D|nr:outer membrane lipoprotein-sorting protein [Sulfurimonas sp. HSL-3221]UFS62806.1 outer membrane lipoprotein-sorting protein [Sulfurimonas sp. HSL-3221]
MQKCLPLLLLITLNTWAISDYDLAKKTDAALSGFHDAVSEMQMTLINANGQTRERTMLMKVLEGKEGDKSLMEFLTPADVKGTKFLNYEHFDRDDDQWLYLPALKRVKRIASRNKSGSFMGSEFSYEDLSAFNIEKYTYGGDAETVELEGKSYYKTVRFPKEKDSGYTKQVSWINPETYVIVRVDYYDRKKALLKTARFSDYRNEGGVWRIGKIVMTNHQNDKETILVWKHEKIDTGLTDKDFHKRVLKQ